MKNLILSLTLIFIVFSYQPGQAQCNEYFPMKEGKSWSYQNFDSKDKLQGSQSQVVKTYEESSAGFEATLEIQSLDKKGKELTKGEIGIACNSGVVSLDMRKFVQEDQLEALKTYDIQVVAEDLEYPSGIQAGTKLKDGKITITASGSPIPMKMVVMIVDRTVEKKESVTTPAGTFDCWKINGKTKMENQMGMNMKFEFDQVEWIAKEVGMVRNESYDKGKLKAYTVLSEVK